MAQVLNRGACLNDFPSGSPNRYDFDAHLQQHDAVSFVPPLPYLRSRWLGDKAAPACGINPAVLELAVGVQQGVVRTLNRPESLDFRTMLQVLRPQPTPMASPPPLSFSSVGQGLRLCNQLRPWVCHLLTHQRPPTQTGPMTTATHVTGCRTSFRFHLSAFRRATAAGAYCCHLSTYVLEHCATPQSPILSEWTRLTGRLVDHGLGQTDSHQLAA